MQQHGDCTNLQVTGKECGSFGFGQHSDLLEGEEVMDVDVVLCGTNKLKTLYLLREWGWILHYRLQFQGWKVKKYTDKD